MVTLSNYLDRGVVEKGVTRKMKYYYYTIVLVNNYPTVMYNFPLGHPVVLFPDHLPPVLLNKRDEVTVLTMTSERKIIDSDWKITESNGNSRRYEELRRYYV